MARTFIRQAAQIDGSENYLDNLGPGSTLQDDKTLEGDLNALRSMLRNATGESKWFDGVSGRTIKGLNTDLATAEADIVTLENDLAAETARALAAEGVLQGNIDAEEARALAAEGVLQGNIDAEATRALAAESALQSDIDAEESRAMAAEGVLQTNIDNEAARALAAEVVLQGNIDAEATTRAADDASEASTRASADLTLQSNIDAEASRALAAEGVLQSAISAEESRAMAAEGVLQSNIDSEATTRAAADSALDTRVSQNETDIVSLFSSVSTLDTNVVYMDGSRPFAADQSMTGHNLTNVADPVNAQDAATKAYVDAIAVGLTIKAPVKAAGPLSAGALPSATAPVDGVTLYDGDRAFFFEPGGSSVEAGIYVLKVVKLGGVDTYSWERAADYSSGDVSSTFFFVQQGSTYADTSWVETADPAYVGMNALAFSQMFGPGTYTNGAGLNLTGREFSIANGGVVESMIGSGAVTSDKLGSGAVTNSKLADGAVTNSKLADGAVDNSKITANTITADRLAFDVATQDELNDGLALKLSLSGGAMSGDIAMGSHAITGLANPTNAQDAATKAYVDSLNGRGQKVYAEVLSVVTQGNALFGGLGGNLDAELPEMPSNAVDFASMFDVFLNGQLLRQGSGNDVNRDATNNRALTLEFDAAVGDVLCVVAYT